jgi:glycosyltransferase involved in cell wall biosynthesis
MANGKIVITTDFPANLEVISPGVNGFTFKTRNPQDLYLTIKKILSLSAKEIELISQKARDFAIIYGDWAKESVKLMNAIKDITEKKINDE